jgi:hypothetical protein
MFTIDLDELARVTGGAEPSPGPNYQKDNIGVSSGGADVGLTKEGWRSNYGLCMEAALQKNWTPEQIKATCGTPPP